MKHKAINTEQIEADIVLAGSGGVIIISKPRKDKYRSVSVYQTTGHASYFSESSLERCIREAKVSLRNWRANKFKNNYTKEALRRLIDLL